MGAKELLFRRDTLITPDFKPATMKEIKPYLPLPDEWLSAKIRTSPHHGLCHSLDCVAWGTVLLKVARAKNISDLNHKAILFALGRHDIGRIAEDEDTNHSIRAVRFLYSGWKNNDSYANLLNPEEFGIALETIRFHSDKTTNMDDYNLRFMRFIDIFTMFARYQHDTAWIKSFTAQSLLTIAPPSPNGNSFLSIEEMNRMIDLNKIIFRRMTAYRRLVKTSYGKAYIRTAKKKGLLI